MDDMGLLCYLAKHLLVVNGHNAIILINAYKNTKSDN